MLSVEIQIFLMTVGFLFLFGVPAIMRKTKLPARFDFKEYQDSELTPAQQKFFAEVDAAFAEINYQPTKTFSVPNLVGSNLNRIYDNSVDASVGVTTLIRTAQGGRNVRYIEFVSKFEDGTRLNTTNSSTSTSMFKRPANFFKQSFPGLQSPAALKQKHDERVAQIAKPMVYRDPKQYQQRMQEYHDAWAGHQVSQGLLKLDATHGEFRATPWLGIRSVFGYLNPIDGGFRFAKFLPGILLGAGLPLLAAAYGPVASIWLTKTAGLSIVVTYPTVLLTSYLVAGVSVGTFFQQRAFIWGFLLAYLPPPLFHMRSLYPFFGSIVVALLADWTAKAHMRRGRLL